MESKEGCNVVYILGILSYVIGKLQPDAVHIGLKKAMQSNSLFVNFY